ncbi:MAG: FAD-dependent monooxygenase [Streptosporangiaceae bacterium]
MLAGELALAGVDVAIVERRATQELDGSRSRGLYARTIEVLDQRGIADRFLSQGPVVQRAGFSGTFLDISDLPTRHNYVLALPQERRPGHPLRPGRGAPAARAPHARPGRAHRRRAAARILPAAPSSAGAAQPR